MDGDRLWILALFYGGDSRFKLVVNSALHNTAPSILAGEIKMQETGQTFHNSTFWATHLWTFLGLVCIQCFSDFQLRISRSGRVLCLCCCLNKYLKLEIEVEIKPSHEFLSSPLRPALWILGRRNYWTVAIPSKPDRTSYSFAGKKGRKVLTASLW